MMKKLVLILSTLFVLQASAQITDTVHIRASVDLSPFLLKTQGVTSIANNVTKDSLIYYINNVRYAIPAAGNVDLSGYTTLSKSVADSTNLQNQINGKMDTVQNIVSLQNYTGNSKVVLVTDAVRGGLFVRSVSSTPDNGVIFTGTSGYWVRQYDKAKGVNVDWWGNTDVAINAAINYVGIGGTVNFTNNTVYSVSNQINPLTGQIFNGNGATLQRAKDSVVTLTATVLATDSSFTVNAIPQSWKTVSGLYQFFSDSTNTNQNVTLYPSTNITGNTIKLGGTIGKAWTASTTFVRRVFSMIYSPNNLQINNLNFDGNRRNTSSNVSWRANSTILAYGYGDVVIDHCHFINIPNENIVGQGLKVTNGIADSLNGSFIHLTAEADRLPVNKPSIIDNNITRNTNLQIANSGHAEGAITNSFTPGYVTITNNRFMNGGTAGVFGYIQSDSSASDGAYRNVVIANNYAENFDKIFYYLSILPSLNRNGHIFIQGNTFNNCGINDWMPFKDSIDKYTDSIMIGANMLSGGTVWKIPIQKSDSLQRYIINNGTGFPQNAFFNISRSATIGDTLSVGNIPTGNITDSAVVTKNKLIKKVSFNDLGFMPTAGGQFTGDISFSNNKILYGRLADFTAVSMLQLDNTNAMNYGNLAIPYSYFYTQNDFTFYNNASVLKRLTIKGNGHTLLGNISDNGTDWLQVGGTINSLGNSIIGKTEAATDSSNNVASTAFVKELNATVKDSLGTIDPLISDTLAKTLAIRQTFVDSIRNYLFVKNNPIFTGTLIAPTISGGSSSGGNLTLTSTTNATKGYINIGANSIFDETNNRWGINTLIPRDRVDINGAVGGSITLGGGNGKTISAYQNGTLDALWIDAVNSRFNGVITTPSSDNGGDIWFSKSDGTNTSYTDLGNTADDRFYINVNGNDVLVAQPNGYAGFGKVEYANSAIQTTSFSTQIRSVGSAYTVADDDHTINCVTGTFPVTLRSSIGISGREYVIANSSTGTITINTTSSQKFNNVSGTPTSLTLVGVGSYKFRATPDSNWVVEAFYQPPVVKGTATLVAGTVTVSAPSVTASSKIFVTVSTPSGTQGFLSVPTASIVAGTSFVINSSSASDTSTLTWAIE